MPQNWELFKINGSVQFVILHFDRNIFKTKWRCFCLNGDFLPSILKKIKIIFLLLIALWSTQRTFRSLKPTESKSKSPPTSSNGQLWPEFWIYFAHFFRIYFFYVQHSTGLKTCFTCPILGFLRGSIIWELLNHQL
jgi:hypothetical protein